MRCHRLLLVLLALLLAPASIARATGIADSPPGGPSRISHLPLNVRDPGMLIACAQRMPAVQAMIRDFSARGYVRHPEADRVVLTSYGFNAVVYLLFEDPSYHPAPNVIGAPAIMVGTSRDQGEMGTVVSGGLVIVDGSRPSIEIEAPGGDEGMGADPGTMNYRTSPDVRKVLGDFFICAVVNHASCLAHGVAVAGATNNAALGVGVALACAVQGTADCVAALVHDWPHAMAPPLR